MSKARDVINMYEMANLRPSDTGLPFFVWIDEMGGYRKAGHHIPRLKIAKGSPDTFVAVVSIASDPKLLEGELEGKETKKLKQWINQNLEILIAHWNGDISTVELGRKIVPMK